MGELRTVWPQQTHWKKLFASAGLTDEFRVPMESMKKNPAAMSQEGD
jgi:hypothetical protein